MTDAEKQALENVAAEYSSNWRHINTRQHFIDGANWLDDYRDAQANEASAEFPEADFDAWFDSTNPELEPVGLTNEECARWGFEKGRASCESDAASNLKHWKKALVIVGQKVADLEAKLAEAEAEIERLKK